MAAGDGGDVRFSIGIDTAGAAAEFKKLSELNTSAAKKMVSQWTRELGSLDAATRDVAQAMLKATEQWDSRLVVLKRAQVALEQELATTKKIAQERAKIASGKSTAAYGPSLTAQQRRKIEFENRRREREAALSRGSARLAEMNLGEAREAYGPAKPTKAFLEAQRMTNDRLKKEAAAREKVIAALEKASQRLVNLGEVERFDAGAFNARGGLSGDIGSFYGESFFADPAGGVRRGTGGGGTGKNRAQRMGRGAYQNSEKRGQAALQQGIFALDDFVTSLGTGGVQGAIRGASNNITSMASLLGGPYALAAGVAVTAGLQLTAMFVDLDEVFDNGKKHAEDLAKAEEKLAEKRKKSQQLFDSITEGVLGRGATATFARRQSAQDRSRELADAAGATITAIREEARLEASVGGRVVTEEELRNRTEVRGLRNRMASYNLAGVNFGTDATSMRGQQLLLGRAERLTDAERNRAGITDEMLLDYRAMFNARNAELFATASPTLDEAGFARAQGQDMLSGLGLTGGTSGRLSDELNDISFIMDDATRKFKDGKIAWEQYVEIVGDAVAAQNKVNSEIKRFVTEQQQQAAFGERRRADLDAFLGTAGGRFAEDRRRQEIAQFIRGGILAGLEEGELRDMAAKRFAATQDPLGEDGILSKATIGANAARGGGDEFSRLLSGDDSGRKLVTISEEQLAAQRQTNDLINEQLDAQLEVAN